MSWKRRFLQRRTAALAGAALTAGVGALLLILPSGLDRLSYDLLFSLRPEQEADGVVIVALDELSHQELRQPDRAPWDRALYGQVLTNLARWNARAVAMDVEFDDNGSLTPADRCLAEGLRFHGRVVLGASWGEGHYLRSADTLRLKLPDPDLVTGEANWGTTVVWQDPDGAVRRHYHGTADVPTLSWRLATMLGLAVTRPAGAQQRERWLNYYGAPGAVPRVRFALAHRGTDAGLSNVFAGKVVFIGAGVQPGYTGSQKEGFRHPRTWLEGTFAPGVEIHATEFLNLMHEDWFRRPGPWLELGIILIAGLGLGAGLALLPPMRALVCGVVAAFAMLGVTWVLAWGSSTWLAWAVVALGQVPVAVVCSLAFQARGAEALKRQGETAEFASPAGEAKDAPRIPDYELLRRIGSGSYGEVWLARSATGQWRAVKVVRRREFGQDRQFEREFEGVRRFEPVSRRHEGLVHVLHVGRNDAEGFFFYVMEAADASPAAQAPGTATVPEAETGTTAAASSSRATRPAAATYVPCTLKGELRRRGPMPLAECAEIGAALAGALDYLHSQRLVHRDIKPSNIIFVEGRAKLADVGLVAGLDEARSFVGTEGFIPPEGPGTPAADVFGLGRVLFEMSTGCEAREFLQARPREAKDEGGRKEFEAILRRACHEDIRERHATAQLVRTELEQWTARFRGVA